MKATTIKPGFLVSLHTATRGGVRYQRVDLEEEKVEVPADETWVSSGDGELVIVQEKKRWETTRVVEDAAEHEMAGKVRSKARGFICSVCVNTPFGLLCPADREQELDAAIDKAQDRKSVV